MWLPIALADVVMMLAATAKRAGGFTGEIKLPKRSDILKSWALPLMGEAVAEDEAEAEAFALLESVRRLNSRQEGKAENGKC